MKLVQYFSLFLVCLIGFAAIGIASRFIGGVLQPPQSLVAYFVPPCLQLATLIVFVLVYRKLGLGRTISVAIVVLVVAVYLFSGAGKANVYAFLFGAKLRLNCQQVDLMGRGINEAMKNVRLSEQELDARYLDELRLLIHPDNIANEYSKLMVWDGNFAYQIGWSAVYEFGVLFTNQKTRFSDSSRVYMKCGTNSWVFVDFSNR